MAPERYFDSAVMERLLDGNRAMMGKFAGKFIRATGIALDEMDAALATHDIKQLRHLGHRARSAALTVGAIEMADLCHRLEQLTDDGAGARTLVQDLRDAYAATVAILDGAGLA